MSLALQDAACAKTDQADYDVVAAFAQFGDIAEPPALDWEPMRAADIVRLAITPEHGAANQHRRPFPELSRGAPRLDSRIAEKAIALGDWAAVFLAAEIAARWGNGLGLLALPIADAAPVLIAALSLKAGLWLTGFYRTPLAKLTPDSAVGGLAIGAMLGLGFAAIAAPDARATAALAAVLPVVAITLGLLHAVAALCLSGALKRGAFAETAVIIGATPAAERFARRAQAEGKLRVAAIVEDRADRAPSMLAGAPVCGNVDDLLAWPDLPKIDRIIICISHVADARVRRLIDQLRSAPNRVDLLFDFEIENAQGRRFERMGGAPLAIVSGRSAQPMRALSKRSFDLIGGAILTLLSAPLMLALAALIRLDSPGPALFRQRRYGLNNQIITIWKFRTMHHGAQDAPTRQVSVNDARVTRIGKLLRRTSLDELPQLFNVLKGDMSLVGPRPHAIDMQAGARALTDIAADYAHRHRVKPGITGWAQVCGSRGPIESDETVLKRVRLDLDYIARASIWLDLWIVARTLPALLGDRKNIR